MSGKGTVMESVFTFEVMRSEWVAQVGRLSDISSMVENYKPYWTSAPFPTREQAVAALEAHPEVLKYNERLMRYEMQKDYTRGEVIFRKTKIDEYDR